MSIIEFTLYTHVASGVFYGVLFLIGLILLFNKGIYTKYAAHLGIAGFVSGLISLLTGGYYYVVNYGSVVKPGIKDGVDVLINGQIVHIEGAKWVHSIVMETKEHEYLILLAFVFATVVFTWAYRKVIMENDKIRMLAAWLYTTAFLGFASIYFQGIIISGTARHIADAVKELVI